MGFKLYREVRDFAPADWSSGELVVALMIADDANDDTRQSWIPLPLLCARTRLKPSSVRAALRKLAERGFELRVPHGAGKDGRQVYATKGHSMDYVVPAILKGATPVTPLPVDNLPKGATPVTPLNGHAPPKGVTAVTEGATPVTPIGPKGVTAVTPLSSKDLNPHISSVLNQPVDGAALEGAQLSTGQEQLNGKHHKRSDLELAAWQAAQSRAQRQAITQEGTHHDQPA